MFFSHPDTLSVLWAAPFCLHDSSSGAAMLVRLMLRQLHKRGAHCQALGALTFDSPDGTAFFPNFDARMREGRQWYALEDDGVAYEYLRTGTWNVDVMTRAEEKIFHERFLVMLDSSAPDVLLLFGNSVLEQAMLAECQRRGIATVMLVLNGNYAQYRFPYTDMVITEVPRSAQCYYEDSRINMLPVGTFIDPETVLVREQSEQDCITFINPHPSKGVSLFLRLALMARKTHPDWKFLVVESRGTWAQALAQFGLDARDFPHVNVAQHTADIRLVYARTKLLLAPSLWFENFGRVAAEAVMNGIPVLASTSGGLPDAVNGGGMCIPAPQHCHDDFLYMPQAEELAHWLTALESMLAPAEYPAWQAKAREAGKRHDIEKSTDTLLSCIHAMLRKKPSVHPLYFQR